MPAPARRRPGGPAAPPKGRPVEGRRVEDRPLDGRRVEDRPVEDRPVEDRPVEDQRVEDRPVDGRLVEDRPVEDQRVEGGPVEDRRIGGRPAEERPVDGGPGLPDGEPSAATAGEDGPAPSRTHEPAPPPGAGVSAPDAAPEQPGAAAPELEPTTGAPVDALPRRAPVRQPKRRRRAGRASDGGTAEDDDPAFWPPIEEVHWDGTPIRAEPPHERDRQARDDPARRRRAERAPRPPDPLPGLAVLLSLSLVAAFFGWVSAGPLWVAMGHATGGTVVIADCTGGGLTQRCRGIFTADGGRFIAHGVRVSGVPAERAKPGTALPARMTGPKGGTAYADTGLAQHLRWLLGLLVVAACGAGIARWTGATLLTGRRARRWAVGAAFAGPALIALGFLVAAW
ncbi:hypothetical protein [Micromonospora sp. WMMD812]|uniref:hypothetical protein n=1 Tax=Micromonospora sp. WMMD812 TaxID=3015152 RepID=UPI00248BE11D|nr:hypothetical protein [Micromonospora sp. WMMD812]WBB65105.1 hypothetical protein O7603_17955 [Micromonospora sp. WMMD812]